MKRILIVLALLCPLLASAATWYVCDCQVGANAACPANNTSASDGNSSAQAQVSTTPWKSGVNLTAAFFSARAAGDQVLFCKDGSVNNTTAAGLLASTSPSLTNSNATKANPIIFGSYTPAWGGTAKPILTNANGSQAAFNFQDGGAANHDEGVVVRDLDIRGGYRVSQSTGAGTTSTLVDSGMSATTDIFAGATICLYAGTGNSTSCRTVQSNTATQFTITTTWPGSTPDATTKYYVFGSNQGIYFFNDVWDSSVENVSFSGFSTGINCSGSSSSGVPSATGESHFFVIKNSTFSFSENGILSGCSNVLIENNTFTNVGAPGPGSQLRHAIYLIDGTTSALVPYALRTVVIRHNTLTDNSMAVAGSCATTVIVAHGLKSGIEILDNEINETVVPGSGCWHIQLNFGYPNSGISIPYSAEGFDRARIMRNKLTNFGGLAIDLGISHNGVVSDNSMYTEFATGASCVQQYSGFGVALEPNDYQQDANTVRDNSCYIKTPTAASIGYRFARHASDTAGTNHVAANNLTYFGTGVTTSTQCFNFTNITASEFAFFDNNLCFGAGGVTPKWHSVSGTKAQWTTDSGALNADANSLTSDPTITAPTTPVWSLAIPTGSPAKAAGSSARASRIAYDGCLRPTPPSIGATEYRASACNPAPNAPYHLR